MAVISSDVVLAGQPWRQNVCVRATANREFESTGTANISATEYGVTVEESTFTGRTIVSTRVPAQRWRLCVQPTRPA